MNKNWIFAVILLSGLASKAQGTGYQPLLREGVKWVYYDEYTDWTPDGDETSTRFYFIEIQGDTVINGKTYKKAFRYSDTVWPEDTYYAAARCSDVSPVACLREEDQVVYAGCLKDTYDDAPFNLGQGIASGEVPYLYDFRQGDDATAIYNGTTRVWKHLSGVFINQMGGECVESIGLNSETEGDLLMYSRSTNPGYPYELVGLHHVEDADGNILFLGKAYQRAGSLIGDATQDGNLGIEDINEMINIILEENRYSAYVDTDDNGCIDISDINDVVNLILSK